MTWTNITNAQLAIGAPLRSIDILALRDNITAQANGDAGAPKQQTAGIADGAVTAPKINFVANGLQNSGGSLAISCPSFNTVGSYCQVTMTFFDATIVSGGNYSAGTGPNQLRSLSFDGFGEHAFIQNNLSGTWKFMGAGGYGSGGEANAIACRVS